MIELAVNNITMQFGETTLFEKITFDVKTAERVGLIGANGCGKTTLMKIIMNLEKAAIGDIFLRKGIAIGYLNQIPRFEEQVNVRDVILSAFRELYEIKEAMEILEHRLSTETTNAETILKHYGELSHRFEVGGGYMMETEFNKIIQGLNISEAMLSQSFMLLSGGEQTRIVLAKILLENPDILLLDEPSNHLDMMSIEWLEQYLANYNGTILIISHDRYFLDQSVNRIIELTYDEAIIYHGNYTYYTIEKERRFLLEMKYYEQNQKKIKRMEDQIKRYRIWGEMRDSDKMYVRAKELEKRLEKMEKVKKPIYESRKINLSMDTLDRTGNQVLQVEGLSKSYNERPILKDIEFNVVYRDFACLLGENGSGKTTLFRLLMEEIEPDTGIIKLGSRVSIGYLPQQIAFENEEMTIVDYFQREHEISQSEARRELAKALFVKDDVFKQLKVLSGGEKSRLKLATLLYHKVNVLLLDEPTNHLDIDSREVLEENLLEFEGTILFISHDRYFVDKLASKIIELENNRIITYPLTYQDYKYAKSKQAALKSTGVNITSETTMQSVKNLSTDSSIPSTKNLSTDSSIPSVVAELNIPKLLSKNQERRLIQLEQDIEDLEAAIKSLEEQLIEVGHNPSILNQQLELIEAKKMQLSALYDEWGKITI